MAQRTRFARIWLLTLLLAMGLAVAFNRLIDPWGLHDGPRFEGVNAVKIRPERPLGELKLSRALRRTRSSSAIHARTSAWTRPSRR